MEKLNKIGKPLLYWPIKKKIQVTNTRNEKEDFISYLTKIKREYYEHLHVDEIDNIDKKNKFLEKHTTKTDSRKNKKYE